MLMVAYFAAQLLVAIGLIIVSMRCKKLHLQIAALMGAVAFAAFSIAGSITLYTDGEDNTAYNMCVQTVLSNNTISEMTTAEMRSAAQNGVPSVIVDEERRAEISARCFDSVLALAVLQAGLAEG